MKSKDKVLNDILTVDAEKVASCFDFQELSNKKVIITGANGLIGVNFIASLLQIGTKVSGIKIFPIIHSKPSGFLSPFLNHKNVQVFIGDLTDGVFTETIPYADIIIHAA
ncbi:hypothetical protein KJ959_07035, partial [bacterium]|nr:hypothetical protein [bacterium]